MNSNPVPLLPYIQDLEELINPIFDNTAYLKLRLWADNTFDLEIKRSYNPQNEDHSTDHFHLLDLEDTSNLIGTYERTLNDGAHEVTTDRIVFNRSLIGNLPPFSPDTPDPLNNSQTGYANALTTILPIIKEHQQLSQTEFPAHKCTQIIRIYPSGVYELTLQHTPQSTNDPTTPARIYLDYSRTDNTYYQRTRYDIHPGKHNYDITHYTNSNHSIPTLLNI